MKKFLMIGLMASVLTGCASLGGVVTKTDATGVVHGTMYEGKVTEILSMKQVAEKKSSLLDEAQKYCRENRADQADCEREATIPSLAIVEQAAMAYINVIIPVGLDPKVGDLIEFERYRMGYGVTSVARKILSENDCKTTAGVWGGTVECSRELRKDWKTLPGFTNWKHPE